MLDTYKGHICLGFHREFVAYVFRHLLLRTNTVEAAVAVDWTALTARLKRTIQHIYDEDDSPEALAKLGITVVTMKHMKALKVAAFPKEGPTSDEILSHRRKHAICIALFFPPPQKPNRKQ